jgi:hypothetical protein
MSAGRIRLKWRVAYALNRIPVTCWPNLVGWCQGQRNLSETRIDSACRSDAARNGACYCEKLRGEA